MGKLNDFQQLKKWKYLQCTKFHDMHCTCLVSFQSTKQVYEI